MIYITSDHAGLNLKNFLMKNLEKEGFEVEDLGPTSYDQNDDYPDFVKILAKKMKEGIDNNLGIVICKNGVGVSVASNKFKHLRAALSWNPEHAVSSKTDDNSNVLALPAGYITEEEALNITRKWIQTPFSNDERHVRRLEKVSNLE